MQAALPFPLAHTSARANVSQVLKHNGRTGGRVLHDTLGEHMVMVFALPKQFARELAQVTFRALGAFGLQLLRRRKIRRSCSFQRRSPKKWRLEVTAG
ncbi:hypothetical protein [Ktedonospora formicarum]